MKSIKNLEFEFIGLKQTNLTRNLEKTFGKKVINVEAGNFADTEIFIKTPNKKLIQNKNIFIIQEFSFIDETINEQFFKLFFLADILKKIEAKKVCMISPYLPYSRQEKDFYKKELGPLFLIEKFLKVSGIDEVISIDLHERNIKENFTLKLYEICLNQFWSKFIKTYFNDLNNICLASPDKGRIEDVKKISEFLDVEYVYIKKTRLGVDHPVALDCIGEVKDKIVIVIDDILDTGKTAINACNLILQKGAKKVFGFFTHAIFALNALESIEKSDFDKIFVTDTILLDKKKFKNTKVNILGVSELILKFLREQY